MVELKGFNELAQAVAYEEIVRTHIKRAERAIKKERLNELLAQGIDKEIAKVMVEVGL